MFMGGLTTTFLAQNSLLAGIIIFVLGIWLFFEQRNGDRSREPLVGLLVYAAFWLLSCSLYLHSEVLEQSLYWLRTIYFTASFLPLFLFFLVEFLAAGQQLSQRFQYFCISINVFLMVLIYFFPMVVGLEGRTVIVGPAMPVLWLHFTVFLGLSMAVMISRYRVLREKLKGNYYLLLIGSLAALGAVFSVIYAVNSDFEFVGPVWLSGMAAMTVLAGMVLIVYALARDSFLVDMRAVGPELFLLIVTLAVVLDAIVTPAFLNFSVKLAIILVLAIYGTLSVRSLTREVQRLRDNERLRAKLTVLDDELRESNRLKTRLLAFATHQLRAILAGIRSYLSMLYDGDFGEMTPRQKETVGVTMVAAERLEDTVDTFLDVAKIEGGRLKIEKKPTDVGALVSRAVREFAPVASKKSLSLAQDVQDGLPLCNCDAGKLYHAIANLINNAIKYTDRGGVTVIAVRDGSWLVVKVSDTGIGLDERARLRVRELFEGGLAVVRFEETGGSGLGLYIARAIVDAHDGQMLVSSPGAGQGSTFGFKIPLA